MNCALQDTEHQYSSPPFFCGPTEYVVSITVSYKLLDWLVGFYDRYPWRRLPLADQPGVAGGYAMATATILATVIQVIGGQIPSLTAASVIGPFWFGYIGLPAGWYALRVGVVAIVAITPLAFVSGILVWRLLPSNVPGFGAIAGLLAAGLTFPFGVLASGVVFTMEGLLTDASSVSTVSELLLSVVYLGSLIFGATFLSLFCILVPVGTLIGYLHHQVHPAPESSN